MDQEETTLADDSQPDTSVQQDGAPEQAAPAPDAAPAEPNAQAAQPAPAAPDANDAGSLKTPNNETNVPPQAPPQRDWSKEGPILEKRYRDLMSHTDRQVNQWQSRMQSQDKQLQEMMAWRKEQEQRAQQAQLKPYNKAHPEFKKFSGLLERAKVVDAQLRRIPANLQPDQQEAMKQAIVSALTPEEQQQISDYREDITNFQRDFFTDPQGTLLPMVEQLAEQKVQQALQKIEAEHAVRQDFEDPRMKPMLEKYGNDFRRALMEMPEKPYEHAKHMMFLYDENQQLKDRLKQLEPKSVMADEQKRLVKGEAAISRDVGAPKPDPYQMAVDEAKKRGFTPDSPRFAALLQKYER